MKLLDPKYLMPKVAAHAPGHWEVTTTKPTAVEKKKRMKKLLLAMALSGGAGFFTGRVLSRYLGGGRLNPAETKRLRKALTIAGVVGSPPITYMVGKKVYVDHPTRRLRGVTNQNSPVQPGHGGLAAGQHAYPSSVLERSVLPARPPNLPLGALPRSKRNRDKSDPNDRYRYFGTPAGDPRTQK